jgi:urate oxidase
VKTRLTSHAYGKSSILLTKVRRLEDRHELVELKVKIRLGGQFERSYTDGDNSNIIATDSMKNTVYLLAKDHPVESPESFALHLADHFLVTYPQVDWTEVHIWQSSWQRIVVDGNPHPTAFQSGGAEVRLATAVSRRDKGQNAEVLQGGLRDLLVLKTTDSAFTGFVRDAFTTLPDSTDRILATKICAGWSFADRHADFNLAFDRIRAALLGTFARHKSKAVQQTLYAMADAALEVEPAISRIHLGLPNKHRVPFDFKPFGKRFENDIYVLTEGPCGEISASVSRARA